MICDSLSSSHSWHDGSDVVRYSHNWIWHVPNVGNQTVRMLSPFWSPRGKRSINLSQNRSATLIISRSTSPPVGSKICDPCITEFCVWTTVYLPMTIVGLFNPLNRLDVRTGRGLGTWLSWSIVLLLVTDRLVLPKASIILISCGVFAAIVWAARFSPYVLVWVLLCFVPWQICWIEYC